MVFGATGGSSYNCMSMAWHRGRTGQGGAAMHCWHIAAAAHVKLPVCDTWNHAARCVGARGARANGRWVAMHPTIFVNGSCASNCPRTIGYAVKDAGQAASGEGASLHHEHRHPSRRCGPSCHITVAAPPPPPLWCRHSTADGRQESGAPGISPCMPPHQAPMLLTQCRPLSYASISDVRASGSVRAAAHQWPG